MPSPKPQSPRRQRVRNARDQKHGELNTDLMRHGTPAQPKRFLSDQVAVAHVSPERAPVPEAAPEAAHAVHFPRAAVQGRPFLGLVETDRDEENGQGAMIG